MWHTARHTSPPCFTSTGTLPPVKVKQLFDGKLSPYSGYTASLPPMNEKPQRATAYRRIFTATIWCCRLSTKFNSAKKREIANRKAITVVWQYRPACIRQNVVTIVGLASFGSTHDFVPQSYVGALAISCRHSIRSVHSRHVCRLLHHEEAC